MKICTKCGIEKSETEFFIRNKQTGRLHAQCKSCYKIHRGTFYASHYAKYRELYISRAKARREILRAEFRANMLSYIADKSCVDCGESDIRVLELDHLDPTTKKFSISQAVKLGYAWVDVLEEMKKCRVLCANCHKKRTAQQFNWYKAL